MSSQRPLRGACSCGRNSYSIVVPESATEQAHVYFDDSSHNRRAQASPLTAWLRVPLEWVSSTTIAQFPDETHTTIRRIFTPQEEPYCKRIFCGFCGTHLSFWTERPAAEADYLSITLGSLNSEDIHALQDLDLLPEDVQPEDVENPPTRGNAGEGNAAVVSTTPAQQLLTPNNAHSGRLSDIDWFEEMIHGSHLGRTRHTRRGLGRSVDGATTVQWEVSEYTELDEQPDIQKIASSSGTKRKIDDDASK